jgi:predicted DNA-binding helix-hairpin-helix protein
VDPKLAWALRNRSLFPVDVNRAPRALLLRIPGVGARSVDRILASRRWRRLRLDDLTRLRIATSRALPFLLAADHNPDARLLDRPDLRDRLLRRRAQLDLFAPAAASELLLPPARSPMADVLGAMPRVADMRSVVGGQL